MIFVALGTQKFQMNRLLEALDQLKQQKVIQEEIYAQTGCSTYQPLTYSGSSFLNGNDFLQKIWESEIVITHSGVGTIMKALNADKKVIVVPRLSEYGEHVDNHQVQIAEAFSSMNLIFMCMNLKELPELLKKIRTHHFNKYLSGNDRIVNEINHYLASIPQK